MGIVQVQVSDVRSGQPYPNIEVNVGNQKDTTDDKGVAHFKDVKYPSIAKIRSQFLKPKEIIVVRDGTYFIQTSSGYAF